MIVVRITLFALGCLPVLAAYWSVARTIKLGRRLRTGRCLQCGYDLQFTPECTCPECGVHNNATVVGPLVRRRRFLCPMILCTGGIAVMITAVAWRNPWPACPGWLLLSVLELDERASWQELHARSVAGRLGGQEARAASRCRSALREHADWQTRLLAVRILGNLCGAVATEADVAAAVTDQHDRVALAAVDTLARMNAASADTTAALFAAVSADRGVVSMSAALAIERLGLKVEPHAAHYVQALASQQPVIRMIAHRALRRLEARISIVSSELELLLNDPDPDIRERAASLLGMRARGP